MKTVLNFSAIRRAIVGLISFCLCLGLVFGLGGLNSAALAESSGDYLKNDRDQLQNYEPYDPVQTKVGGMNQYEDTDPRRDTSAAEAKAERLRRDAESRQAPTNPLNAAGESLKNLGQQVKDSAEQVVN
ncbi:MAG: hypothetical protein HC886_15120 [Leptolyngbyaceae cyanobacterium SM1_1_3]|nr:hypothetical protein [Leptolyngbyaceae cyanobacterium SM1_1_3]NJN03446.1 hypothetical protein [Leptolyngbyaceae cyanobacterium RM1_1_2]NJO08792.1 hypothetical protein [Leptolyngbyaceae cyanobacterium SL_1_1]